MAYHGWLDASAAALRSRLPAALALRGSLAQSRAPIIEAIIYFAANGATLNGELSKDTLTRFENMFKAINSSL